MKNIFNREYFNLNANSKHGGYLYYVETLLHWFTARRILDLKPRNTLELGCARGFVIKHLNDLDVPSIGVDVSDYCYLTRVHKNVTTFDLSVNPWPFKDKEFDVCFSYDLLNLIPAERLDAVLAEVARVSTRGIHIMDMYCKNTILSQTQQTAQPVDWWKSKFNTNGMMAHDPIDSASFWFDGMYTPEYNLGLLKLNFGSYVEMFDFGWVNIDELDLSLIAQTKMCRFWKHDSINGFPNAKDNSTTAIKSSYYLNKLSSAEADDFLTECWRMLVVGGTVRIAVPDIRKLKDMANQNKLGYFDPISQGCELATTQQGKLETLCINGHKSQYDEDLLASIMTKAGFTKIKKMDFNTSRSKHVARETYDLYPDMSLYMEATKLSL